MLRQRSDANAIDKQLHQVSLPFPAQRFIQAVMEFPEEILCGSQPSRPLAGCVHPGLHTLEIDPQLDFFRIDPIELALEGFGIDAAASKQTDDQVALRAQILDSTF